MMQYRNRALADPSKWICMDIECDGGCGLVPFRYRDRNFVNALQWAIGLELFLLVEDPWRIFLTTDHPNGAPFTIYPQLIRLLMDRSLPRRHAGRRSTGRGGRRAPWASLDARIQPGRDRHHHARRARPASSASPIAAISAPGAVADIAVYTRAGRQGARMFATPRLRVQGRPARRARRRARRDASGAPPMSARPEFDRAIERRLRDHFERFHDRAARQLPRRRRRDRGRWAAAALAVQQTSGPASRMIINGVAIEDTFAEAFGMRATRLIITADTAEWAETAAAQPDRLRDLRHRLRLRGRHRARARAGRDAGRAARRLRADLRASSARSCRSSCSYRVGQCVLTSAGHRPASPASTATEHAEARRRAALLRRRPSRSASGCGERRYWRIPVMDGEFLCEDTVGMTRGGRRRQLPDPRPHRPGRARRRRAGGRGDAPAAERDPALPRRHRALRLQGRLEVQGPDRLHQRRLLPDAEGRRRRASCRPRSAPCSRSSSTASPPTTCARGHARRHRRRLRPRRRPATCADHRRQLRRQARQVPLPSARGDGVSGLIPSPLRRGRRGSASICRR